MTQPETALLLLCLRIRRPVIRPWDTSVIARQLSKISGLGTMQDKKMICPFLIHLCMETALTDSGFITFQFRFAIRCQIYSALTLRPSASADVITEIKRFGGSLELFSTV